MTLKNLIRKEVLDLPSYHLEEHPGVKLDQNESPWDIPVAIKARVVENLLKANWNRYPLNDIVLLKKKMAKHLNVWPDNLVFSNGSNVLIQALILATAVKSKVFILYPSFSVYELQANLLGNKVYRQWLNTDFSIPVDDCLRAIAEEKPHILFIPNPNAPTGTLFDQKVLRRIIEATQGLVVIDEAYYPFSRTTLIDWVKEYDHLVILRTFSKAFALGGLRIGYLIAEPDIAHQVQKCLLPFCLSKLAIITAMSVLEDTRYVDDYVNQIIVERERVFLELKKITSITVYKSHANFILIEVEKPQMIFKKLVEEKVIIRQVADKDRLASALRVTIGTKEENDQFLAALKKVLH